jgi:hypothetical protein
MDRVQVTVAGISLPGVEQFDVGIARTYTDEIKRTVKGAVIRFPLSYKTIGISIATIMEVRAATQLQWTLLQTDTVSFSAQNSKYNVTGTVSATEPPTIERLRDADDDLVRITMQFVSVGIPTVSVSTASGGKIVITMPAS